MANLHATIVVRTKGAKHSWIVANGKSEPVGSYYLRQSVASTPKHTHAGTTYEEAEIAHRGRIGTDKNCGSL